MAEPGGVEVARQRLVELERQAEQQSGLGLWKERNNRPADERPECLRAAE
jgi:hypothetical protein